MSMNFAREQSLLRQRLQAKASPDVAQARQQQHGGGTTFLGADDNTVAHAAAELAATHPQMGRAQMTAFVRTLWNSKIHELRSVGVQLLAARASLLEPADLPFLEGLLQEATVDAVAEQLAADVVGALVVKNKKLWKDLKRFAGGTHDGLRRAALRAARLPLTTDPEAFPRFAELATPLLAHPDALVQRAIDGVLAAAAATHGDAARAFAALHNRQVEWPKAKVVKAPKPAAPAAAAAGAPPKKTAGATKAAKKPAAKKRSAGSRAD